MIKKLSDRIFYMEQNDETDRPSLGLICGNKYSLIVDSGNSPKHAKEFLSELNSMNIPPVKYLVLTHWHWDHIFGIKEMNLITIAHENTKEKLDEMKKLKWDDKSLENHIIEKKFAEFAVNCIKKEMPEKERNNLIIGDLDITFNDSIEIDLGGVTCIVKVIGGDHSDDTSIIYVPEEKTLFLGDCIYGNMYNDTYGYTIEKLFPMIEKIEKYDAEHHILSHQGLWDNNKINEFWNLLRTTGQIVGKDTSVEQATKRFINTFNRQPSEDEVFYIKCFADVNKALTE